MDRSVELCVRMLQYAFFAAHTQNRRAAEVKDALRFFFTEEEISAAVADISVSAELEFHDVGCVKRYGVISVMGVPCECEKRRAAHSAGGT